MNLAENIPLERLDFDFIMTQKDFIQPLLFPITPMKDTEKILYIGGNSRIKERLVENFPGIQVDQIEEKEVKVLKLSAGKTKYIFILATDLKPNNSDFSLLISLLTSLLKQGGIIAFGVYGYAGFYGLEMLSRIVRHYIADIENPFANSSNLSVLKRVVSEIIEGLPNNHPVFLRETWIQKLKQGDQLFLKGLLNIHHENIYTVSQLWGCIKKSKGQWIDWVVPNLYNPRQYITLANQLEKFPKQKLPQRWQIAEMINASPPQHYFFLSRKDSYFFQINWDSSDLYLWSPTRLPLYQWEQIEFSTTETVALKPINECQGLKVIKIKPWQAMLLRESMGNKNVNQIIASIKEPPNEIFAFLKQAFQQRLLALLPPHSFASKFRE